MPIDRMGAAEAVSGALAEEAYGNIYSSQYADAMKAARVNKLAKRLGLPADVVEADLVNMTAEERVQRLHAESLNNPAFARMMSNPRLAAVAGDDEALPKVAASVVAARGDAGKNPGFDAWARRLRESTAINRAPPTYQLKSATRGQGSSPSFNDRLRRFGVAGAVARSLRDIPAAAGSLVGRQAGGLLAATGDILFEGKTGLIPGWRDSNPLSEAGRALGRFYGEQQEQTTVRYDNWYIDQMARGLESVPQQVGALVAAASGYPGAAVGMLSSLTGGGSYLQAKEAGLSTPQAVTFGASQAALEAAGEALPIFRYADDALKGSGFFKRIGGQLVTENLGEQFTGHLQDLNEWAAIEANQGKTFLDYLDERPGAALSIALSTTTAVGAQTGAVYGIEKAINRVGEMRQAKREGKLLSRVMDGAAESTSRTASPDEFKAALQEQLEGTPAENLYVSVEAVRALYQSPEDLGSDDFWGDYIDEIAEAEALGGDVVIPLSDAATRLAGTPHWEAIKDHARLSPGGSSNAEIAQWEADFADAAQQTGEQLASMLAEEREAAEPVEKIYEGMRDKLMLAGYTPDAASALAVQFAQRQRVRAERLGVELTGQEADALEIRQVLPPKLASTIKAAELPDEGLKAVITEMKRNRDVRSDKAKFGPSLIDWIIKNGGVEDPGGDLKSMGASPLKGIAKKGQRKLIRPTAETGGMFGSQQNANTLDEMALRAWEAGYFPEFAERPTVNDMLDAIGEGLGGRDRYVSTEQTEEDDLREAAQELYALLDQQGLDPRKASPREIAKAVARYQEQQSLDQGRGYEQLFDEPAQPERSMTPEQRAELEARQQQSMARRGGQVPISDQSGGLFSAERDQRSLFQAAQIETPEFRAWFGDSKVVDEQGRPLVVYHGTTEDVETFDASRRGANTGAESAGMGFFFTDDVRTAESYGHYAATDARIAALLAEAEEAEKRGDWDAYDAKVVEMEALDASFADPEARLAGQNVVPVYLAIKNPLRVDAKGENAVGFDIPAAIRQAVQGGHDGLIIDNLDDAAGLFNVPATHYVVFGSTQIKSATGNSGTFDPANPSILNQSYEEGGARGRITFMGGGTNVIELFEKRDLSTFIHETGHLYLEELKADAGMAGQGQLLQDWETVKAWFKANGHEVGDDGFIPTEAHEMWARGFERYAMEGKAPSSALRKAFEAFRSWLLTIYKVVDNLRSPITPEIRDVMARLIATDEEIAAATGEQNIDLLFKSAEQAGMTDPEYSDYVRAATEARDEAFDALLYRTMAPIRAARTQEHREREAAVRAEVMAQVDDQPLYRALRLLKSGEDGKPMRLNRQWLIDTYGADVIDGMPKSVPPIYADKNTFDADVIAEAAGFTSGDEMVRMLIGYEDTRQDMKANGDKRSPRQAAIDELTKEAMAERYGDPLSDGSIEAEARALIHNDKQGEVIASEVRSLARRTGQRPTPYSIARKWARDKIRSGTIAEVISGAAIQRYQRAARNAAKAAETAMLERNVEEAFRQKQAQMLNNALISEASKAKDAVDSAVARLGKTAKRKSSKSIDQSYLDQAHALLESVEFKRRSQTNIERQKSFEEWAAEQRANGIDVATPQGFAESIGRRHWSRLTVEELTGLDDTVKQILHLGRLKQTLLDGQERRQRDEIIAEMRATAEGVGKGPPTNLNDPSRSFIEGAKSKLRGADAALIKIEQLVDWLDRGNPNGIFNRMLFKPLADAQGREADMMRDYVERINAAVDAMPKKQLRDWRRKVDTPELINRIEGHPLQGEPWSFYKDQVVMMAMNWGNEGNRQRLMDGYGWSEAQVQAVLDRNMTAEDWAFVQSVWDTIDGLWPEVEALEKRVNGVAPDKVAAIPVVTPFGTFNGGYFPAVYDPQWSTRTDDQEAESLLEKGYVRANVTSSATKARADKVKRPILLSMDVITRHLGEVIHDITHREALTETWRLVSDERVQRVITNALGREYTQTFKPWLKHVANDQARNANSNSTVVNVFRRLAHNVSIVGLGYRLTSTVAQIAGIPNVIAQIGERRMIEGWARFLANPLAAHREVTTKSGEMRDRFSTMDRDIVERAQQASKKGIAGIKGPAWFAKYAYHGILIMDSILTTAGWIGAYRKGVAENMSEEEAIYYADKVVRKSQGAGGAKDQAAITREHAAVKPFVMFFSYLSALYSQQRDFGHRLRRISGVADTGRVLHFGFWAIIAPPLLDAWIRGDWPDDDEDDESIGAWIAQRIAFANMGSIPGIRDIGGAIDRDFGYKMTPIQNIGDAFIQGWGNVKKTLDGDEDTEASSRWVKQTLTLFGLTFGQPTGQIANTAQYGYDVATGEQDQPETIGQAYEGLTKGKVEATE